VFDARIISKKLLPLFKPRLPRAMRLAKPYAMISRNRMQNLHRLLYRIERDGIQGDAVETGVARGGSAILIASLLRDAGTDRQVWLYDAFELFDPAFAKYDEARCLLFEELRFDPDRVHLIKGLFEDTLPKHPDRPIAFLHVDAGGYETVRCCLENLWPQVQPGGWVAMDNYGVDPQCRRAADEFLAAHKQTGSLHRFSHAQAYFQRLDGFVGEHGQFYRIFDKG